AVVSGAAVSAAPAGRRHRVGRARVGGPPLRAADGDAASPRAQGPAAGRPHDRGVAGRDGRELADPQRPERAPAGAALGYERGRAAPSERPGGQAAPPFARVLGEMFGPDPAAAAIGLPTQPLDATYAEPARAYIERNGGTVRTGAPAAIRIDRQRLASVESAG